MRNTFNIEGLVRPNIAAMSAYSSARDEFKNFDTEMIFLDANESPFETGVNRYPDPKQVTLKELLASQRDVSIGQVLIGNGSDEVLDLLFRAFCIPGVDNVITLPPTYGMYNVLASTNDIENRKVLLDENFQPDVTKILQAVDDNTKLLFFCSPNNPTGNLMDADRLTELLEQFNGLVIIDEAYIDFTNHPSWVDSLILFPHLVITQTLSKAYGLAGVRLGSCYANQQIIDILNKIKPPYNVNSLSQERALDRVQHLESVALEVDTLVDTRNSLGRALKGIGFIEKVFPSDANFLLARVDDATKRYNQLLEKGIVVRNRSTQPLCENTLRFTVGTTEETEQLINALKELE